MKVVLITAPVIEPVSLAEIKLHLRLDSGSFADNVDEAQSLVPDTYVVADNYTTHVGDGVEVLGYTALVILNSGTNLATGTVDVKIQESDDDVTYADWTGGAFTQVTTANDNAIQEIAYTGTKRYIRTVAKVLLASCDFGTTIIRLTATAIEDDLLNDFIKTARLDVENDSRRQLITATWEYYLDEWPKKNYIVLPFGNLQTVTHIKWKDDDGTETNLTKALTAFAASDVSPATKTKVTSAAHGFADGDLVFISGTTSYNGAWEISNVTTNTFDITTAFVADDATGTATTDYIVETNGNQCGRVVLPYGGSWPSGTLYPSNPIIIRFICGYGDNASDVPGTARTAIKFRAAKYYTNRGEDVIGMTVHENKTYTRLVNNIPRLYDEFN